MKILFTRRHNPGSWLIRAVTWSEFSHVDAILPDGRLIGACAPHGVVFTPKWVRLEAACKAVSIDVPCDSLAALTWATKQLGTPYDWLGCAGVGLHRDWTEPDKWFCSEFVAAAMAAGGYSPYRAETMRRITPQDLYSLNFPVEVLK